MNDYTPTTKQVRDDYRFSKQRPDICGKDFGTEFDRWLNQVKAEVWDDAYNWGMAVEGSGGEDVENPYRAVEIGKGTG